MVFSSAASNLSDDHRGPYVDIFLWNRLSNKIVCLTEGADGDSSEPTISSDGEVIAFSTKARLSAADQDDFSDIYLYTRRTSELTLLRGTNEGDAVSPTLNGDGSLVAFVGKEFGYWQIFGWSAEEKRVALLSRNAADVAGNGDSFFPSLSDSGLVFSTQADNLVGFDANVTEDVMLLVGNQMTKAIEGASRPVIARDSREGLCIKNGQVLLIQLQGLPTARFLREGREASLSRQRVLTANEEDLIVDLPDKALSRVVNSTFQLSPAFEGPRFENIGIARYGKVLYLDINSDNRKDIVAWADDEAGPRGFILSTAQADGSFSSRYLSVGGTIEGYDYGDLNEDGRSDLVVTGYSGPAANPVRFLRVYFGDGAGGFISGTEQPISRLSAVPIVGHFDSDEHQDVLLFTRVFSGTQAPDAPTVLLGSGTGVLTGATTLPVTNHPGAPLVGRFDTDGDSDIAVLDNSTGEVAILLNNGDAGANGPIQRLKVTDTSGFDFHTGAVVDIDLDGDLDLLVGVLVPEGAPHAQVLLNSGGTFTLGVVLPVYVRGYYEEDQVLSADFDGDGQDEILIGDRLYEPTSGEVQLWKTSVQSAIAAFDANNDGKTDILLHNETGVVTISGNGDNTFGLPRASEPRFLPLYASVNGDFTNDLLVDVASTDQLLEGTEQKVFDIREIQTGIISYDLAAEDFNNDGNLDLLSMQDNSFTVHLGNGEGEFQALAPQVVSRLWNIAPELQDIDQDGNVDLFLIRNGISLNNSFEFWKGAGDGTFALVSAVEQRSSTNAIHLADVNSDGAMDMWAADYVIFAIEPGVFGVPVDRTLSGPPFSDARFGDLDGDRKIEGFSFGDFYSAAFDGLDVEPAPIVHQKSRLFQYSGQTETTLTILLGEERTGNQNSLNAVLSEDADGDGDLDLQILDALGNLTLALNNGDGTYTKQPPRHVGANPTRAQRLDFDFDGKFEKLLTGFGAAFI